jgi:type II secretory pathway component PulL
MAILLLHLVEKVMTLLGSEKSQSVPERTYNVQKAKLTTQIVYPDSLSFDSSNQSIGTIFVELNAGHSGTGFEL